eukprot:Pgem_evm1s19755
MNNENTYLQGIDYTELLNRVEHKILEKSKEDEVNFESLKANLALLSELKKLRGDDFKLPDVPTRPKLSSHLRDEDVLTVLQVIATSVKAHNIPVVKVKEYYIKCLNDYGLYQIVNCVTNQSTTAMGAGQIEDIILREFVSNEISVFEKLLLQFSRRSEESYYNCICRFEKLYLEAQPYLKSVFHTWCHKALLLLPIASEETIRLHWRANKRTIEYYNDKHAEFFLEVKKFAKDADVVADVNRKRRYEHDDTSRRSSRSKCDECLFRLPKHKLGCQKAIKCNECGFINNQHKHNCSKQN